MIAMEVVGVQEVLPSDTPVVLLREADGERMLPIFIGLPEAKAIALASGSPMKMGSIRSPSASRSRTTGVSEGRTSCTPTTSIAIIQRPYFDTSERPAFRTCSRNAGSARSRSARSTSTTAGRLRKSPRWSNP